jgi:hypothetical protein
MNKNTYCLPFLLNACQISMFGHHFFFFFSKSPSPSAAAGSCRKGACSAGSESGRTAADVVEGVGKIVVRASVPPNLPPPEPFSVIICPAGSVLFSSLPRLTAAEENAPEFEVLPKTPLLVA